MCDSRDLVAEEFRTAAEKLERAAAHCRIAAKHYTDRDIPRGGTHAYAALEDLSQTGFESAFAEGDPRMVTEPRKQGIAHARCRCGNPTR